jgi:hypothetical protein
MTARGLALPRRRWGSRPSRCSALRGRKPCGGSGLPSRRSKEKGAAVFASVRRPPGSARHGSRSLGTIPLQILSTAFTNPTGIGDGGKDAIGRFRAILVGGLEGNRRGQWLRELKRGRVVERVDIEPGEEAPRVGRLARLSERARGESQLPACGRQCASERARDLRGAPRGERRRAPRRRVRARRARGRNAQAGASTPNRLLPARFDSRPSAGHGGASAAPAAPGPSEAQWRAESLRRPTSARSARGSASPSPRANFLETTPPLRPRRRAQRKRRLDADRSR